MTRRLCVMIVVLLGTGAVNWALELRPEPHPSRAPLATLPLELGDWQGREAAEFDERTLAVLGVDDMVNREYRTAAAAPVSLYIGYYESQRTGDKMHSPMQCLPGTGWQPLVTGETGIDVQDADGGPRRLVVNRYLVEKGLQRHVVLFWYQLGEDVVANEFAMKFVLMRNAITRKRTDGALVRVIVPVAERANEAAADAAARAFISQLFPRLGAYLPV